MSEPHIVSKPSAPDVYYREHQMLAGKVLALEKKLAEREEWHRQDADMLRRYNEGYIVRNIELAAENAMWRNEIKAASGELLVPIPVPGSNEARVFIANRLMRDERDREIAKRVDAEERARGMERVITEYLEWGAMTGSDRDLFEHRFRAALTPPPEAAKRGE